MNSMDIQVLTEDFFDLTGMEDLAWLTTCQHLWEALAKLESWLQGLKLGTNVGEVSPLAVVEKNVSIGQGTVVEAGAVIKGPTFIGKNCEIRAGAYIRGLVYVGDNSVVGHGTEVKHSILLSGVRVDHFNYIRSSVLGRGAHLGAGAVLASVKMPLSEIVIRYGEQSWSTGLEKFGAVLGDYAEVGCNAVLNPGSIIGKESIVYPLVSWRGVLLHGHIAKSSSLVVAKEK